MSSFIFKSLISRGSQRILVRSRSSHWWRNVCALAGRKQDGLTFYDWGTGDLFRGVKRKYEQERKARLKKRFFFFLCPHGCWHTFTQNDRHDAKESDCSPWLDWDGSVGIRFRSATQYQLLHWEAVNCTNYTKCQLRSWLYSPTHLMHFTPARNCSDENLSNTNDSYLWSVCKCFDGIRTTAG